MYETRGVRPYYTIPHIGILGVPFRKLTGFEYKRTIYVISGDMNSTAYYEVDEMARATEHFRRIWHNSKKTGALLADIKRIFREAAAAENYGWRADWRKKETGTLLKDLNFFYDLLFQTFTRMIISQPQHVLSLDQEITSLLLRQSNPDKLLTAATYHPGALPWAAEEKELARLHKTWKRLSVGQRENHLDKLVKEYGWFNEIEGDRAFDRAHYREKIINFKVAQPHYSRLRIPADIRRVGRLIGELGFLRFWNRYHFMTLRYHLKGVLQELTRRSGRPDLEFATIAEVNNFFAGRRLDWREIRARQRGYAAELAKGVTRLVTGRRMRALQASVKENVSGLREIRGSIANKGRVEGRVRVISFAAADYNKQVVAFREGEILVTGMTRPQIVHLCRKAAAIVTDEGGITSHAAVIGREFNLPCIIATHDATKVLKTGDWVEVDADKGLVKKIIK